MKLLILSFYYAPDLGAGAFRTAALVEQLAHAKPKDMQIDVITTQPNRYVSYQAQAPEIEQYDGVRVRRIAVPQHSTGMVAQSLSFAHFMLKVRQMAKQEKYDVVYATASRLLIATLGAWVAKCQKACLYLDIRDLFVDTIGDVFPPFLSKMTQPIFARIEQWTFTKAQHMNLVSKGFAPYIQQRYPEKKLSFYTNGIDKDFLRYSFNTENKASEQFVVLYAGNIGEGQGLERIIPQLAKRLEDCARFIIIGDGGRKEPLQIAVQDAQCVNVEFMPPMSRIDLIEAYQQADVLFLHLNDYAAFRKVLPSKIFEYAATGKPIWAGVAGHAAKFMQEEIPNAAVFPPCDVETAVQELSTLQFGAQDRPVFVEKYQRDVIMKTMATELLSYCT
ncbi:MAG: glycosyltransferase family 4 protein [Gammaproteobacteria bacterium]|nr:glycosyltransferase family 4 protein [Gammaproteobacteria bacterium]